jgi:hypothetical protein
LCSSVRPWLWSESASARRTGERKRVWSGGSPTVAATNFVDGTGAVLVLREAQGTMREADRRSRCLHLQRVRRVVRHPFRDGAVTQALVEAIAAAQPALARCRWRVPTSCQPPRGRAGCVRRAHPSTPNTTARHSDPRAASPPAADRPAPLSSQSARSSKLRRSRKKAIASHRGEGPPVSRWQPSRNRVNPRP